MSDKFPICPSCDAKDFPHPAYTDCKDSEIGWLRFYLSKAKQKIEFLEEIIRMKMKD